MTTLTPVQQKLLEGARAEHGGAEAMLLDGTILVIVRKPTTEEFVELEELTHRIACGAEIKDPGIVYRPLLELVCVGRPDLQERLDTEPGLELDVRGMAMDAALADIELTPIEEVPPEITKQHGAVLLLSVGGEQIIVRKLDRFDWMRYRGESAKAGRELPGFTSRRVMAKTAAQQVVETADPETGRKARFEALCARYPTLPVMIGFMLIGAAQTRSERVRGK